MRIRHQKSRQLTYRAALAAIKKRFPMKVCCEDFEVGGCTHGVPCECGGMQTPWPWIIHHPTASPFCECHLSFRREWVRPEFSTPNSCGPTSSAELIAKIEHNERGCVSGEGGGGYRPECQKEGYSGSGCGCNVCDEDVDE